MTVAVTGATGYVGRFIVKRLIEAGERVRAWRRPSSDIRGLPEAIEWIEGDLASPEAAEALVAGADVLVHAALEHLPGRYRGGEGDDLPDIFRVNVGGSLSLLAMARQAGVKRAVVLSSRAVFGSAAGPLGDDAPVSPDTHYGAAKVALEAFVQSFGHEGWPIAALRPTGVYGVVSPVEKSKWFTLVEAALRGEAVAPRAGTEVHGDDVADSILRLLRADAGEIAGRAFNCSDIVVSHRDIVDTVQRLAGVSGPLPDEAPSPNGVMRCDGLLAARRSLRRAGTLSRRRWRSSWRRWKRNVTPVSVPCVGEQRFDVEASAARIVRRRPRRDQILQRVLVEHFDEGAERASKMRLIGAAGWIGHSSCSWPKQSAWMRVSSVRRTTSPMRISAAGRASRSPPRRPRIVLMKPPWTRSGMIFRTLNSVML